jgi:hypothetical protein
MEKARELKEQFHLYSGVVLVTKRKDRSIDAGWAKFAPLFGWAGVFAWECWGARVLISGICTVETGPDSYLLPGHAWTISRSKDDSEVAEVNTNSESGSTWPHFPRTGGSY